MAARVVASGVEHWKVAREPSSTLRTHRASLVVGITLRSRVATLPVLHTPPCWVESAPPRLRTFWLWYR